MQYPSPFFSYSLFVPNFDKFRLVKFLLSLYVGFMFRRKLFINLAVILFCGTIAISLPIIVNHLQKPASADTYVADWELVSTFVGKQYQNQLDDYKIWQLELCYHNQVMRTWNEIYQSIQDDPTLVTYDHDIFKLTAYGFCQIKTTTGAPMVVTYQGKSCTLQY